MRQGRERAARYQPGADAGGMSLRDYLLHEGICIACLEDPLANNSLYCVTCSHRIMVADAKSMGKRHYEEEL